MAGAWGATFVMVKDALDEVGPLTFVALRFGIAALAMLPFVALRPREVAEKPRNPSVILTPVVILSEAKDLPSLTGWLGSPRRLLPTSLVAQFSGSVVAAGALVGAFLFAGYALQTAGLQFTGAGRAGFITGLNVVIVPLLAATVVRQPIGRAVALGVALATVGLGLLSLGDLGALSLGDVTPASPGGLTTMPFEVNVGDVLVLGCAVAFALHILAVGRYAALHDVLALTFVQIAAVAVLGAIAALIWERPTLDGLTVALPAALFTGLVCTVVAFTIQVQAQRFTSPTRTALVFSTEPVFAAVFAYWLGGERFGPVELGGCALILAGMILAQVDE